ncbi:MAG: L-rhamnose mutarotase [Thermoguttaceae bacterium]
MKRNMKWAGALAILVLASFLLGAATQKPKPIKRVGMVVGIKPERIEEYRRLHADSNAGVRDLLNKYHMRNFSIFLQQIEGKWYEFGYYEYTGDDFDADMAALAKEPRNIEWLKVCDPMQAPLPGDKSWTKMERVYYNP